MGGRFSVATIAGVAVTDLAARPARVQVVGGEPFKSSLVGASEQALDFTVHSQLSSRGVRGINFGITVAQLPVVRLNEIVAAIVAALNAGNDFIVTASDESGAAKVDNISVYARPDFRAMGGAVFKRGALSGDYVKDLDFRFISTAPTT